MGNTFDKIEQNLYLGNKHSYEEPEQDKFQAIVTALTEAEVRDSQIREKVGDRPWLYIPLDDSPEQDISQHFLKVILFIHKAREQGQCVLVHCAAGVSRSATLVCAYLMWEHQWSRKQAMEHLTKHRKIVDPNDGFMNQLQTFEQYLAKLEEDKNSHIHKDVDNGEKDQAVEHETV